MKKGFKYITAALTISAVLVTGASAAHAKSITLKDSGSFHATYEQASRYAKAVKSGTTTVKMKGTHGWIKFKAPKTRKYTFRFNAVKNMKKEVTLINNGFLSFYKQNADYVSSVKVKVKGGENSSVFLSNNKNISNPITASSFLPSRDAKLKLAKNQTIYIYTYFVNPASFKVTIK